MTVTQENKLQCDYCGITFKQKWRHDKHLCDKKRRWQNQNKPENRIAHEAWNIFYKVYNPHKLQRSHIEFINSPYYNGFLNWGTYCVSIGAVAPDQFARWLLDRGIPIDQWASDTQYTKYIVEYLRLESPLDAVRRGITYLLNISDVENCLLRDVFRLYNSNRLCQGIIRGQLSAWILYNHQCGIDWLDNLNDDQRSLIFDYIDPQLWAILFKRSESEHSEIRDLLNEAFK